jgi:hypothetical protein
MCTVWRRMMARNYDSIDGNEAVNCDCMDENEGRHVWQKD